MEIVNPLAGSLAQSTAVTRQQSADKAQQIRRAQALRKDVAATGDTFEHQVESAEELSPIHDEQKQRQPGRNPKRRGAKAPSDSHDDGDAPRIDVTA